MSVIIELARDSILSLVLYLAPRSANVLLLILIGRLAGPAEAGTFALATTYLLIFTTLTRGMDDLVIRQVTRQPERSSRYLTNFLSLRLVLSLLLYGVLTLLVYHVMDYTPGTMSTILILTMSLVPDSLVHVTQAILLGKRRFASPAGIMATTSLLKLIGGAWVLYNGGGPWHIAWVWLGGSLIGGIAMTTTAILAVGGLRWSDWCDIRPLSENWRATLPFLFITTLTALESQADTVLLSAFHSESEVGWYGAATTIAFSLTLFSQAYRMSVYPLMTRYAAQASEKLGQLYQRSLRYLGMLILPMVAGIALLATPIVNLIFGPDFQPTASALQILIFALIALFLNEPLSRMMLAHDRQEWNSLFLLGSVAINLTLNLTLDPGWGARGAATARLASVSFYFAMNYLYVSRHLQRASLLRLLAKPALATLAMALLVWPLRHAPLPLTIAAGALVYLGALWAGRGIWPEDIHTARQLLAHLHKTATNRYRYIKKR